MIAGADYAVGPAARLLLKPSGTVPWPLAGSLPAVAPPAEPCCRSKGAEDLLNRMNQLQDVLVRAGALKVVEAGGKAN